MLIKRRKTKYNNVGTNGGITKIYLKKGFNFIRNALTNLAFYDRPLDILEDLIYNKNRDKQDFSRYQLNEDIFIPNQSTLYQKLNLLCIKIYFCLHWDVNQLMNLNIVRNIWINIDLILFMELIKYIFFYFWGSNLKLFLFNFNIIYKINMII